jgi:hypothetical protein
MLQRARRALRTHMIRLGTSGSGGFVDIASIGREQVPKNRLRGKFNLVSRIKSIALFNPSTENICLSFFRKL